MNFATRFLTMIAGMLGRVPATQGAAPVPMAERLEPGQIARYFARRGMPSRRTYALPRLPGGESYTHTPDRRMVAPSTRIAISAAAAAKRGRKNTSRLMFGTTRTVLGERRIGFMHSPGLVTASERFKRQAVRAERKALARGEITTVDPVETRS